MLKLLIIVAIGFGLYYLYRRIRTAESGWAEIARVIIWGESRVRK